MLSFSIQHSKKLRLFYGIAGVLPSKTARLEEFSTKTVAFFSHQWVEEIKATKNYGLVVKLWPDSPHHHPDNHIWFSDFATEFVNKTSEKHTISLHHNQHCHPLAGFYCHQHHGNLDQHHFMIIMIFRVLDHHDDQPELIILVVITCRRCSRPPGSISRWWL